MNPVIVSTVALTVGIAEFSRSLKVANGHETLAWNPSFRPVVAGFVLGLFLLGIDEVAPEVTPKLCTLIIVTDLLLNGKPVFDYLATI